MMLMNYYGGTDETTWPMNNTRTVTTTPWWWEEPRYYTTAITWSAPVVIAPKWRRWFDVFRTWKKPKLLRLLDGVRRMIFRVQERYPIGQRRKEKRRAYVQRLHAL